MKLNLKSAIVTSIIGAFVVSAQAFAADCTQNNGSSCTAYLVCNRPQGCSCTIVNEGTHSINYNDVCLASNKLNAIKISPIFFPYYLGSSTGSTLSFYAENTSSIEQTLTIKPDNGQSAGISVNNFSTEGLASITDYAGNVIYNGGTLNQQQILNIISMTNGRVWFTYKIAARAKQFVYLSISSYYQANIGFTSLPITIYNQSTSPTIYRVYPLADLDLQQQRVVGTYPTVKGEQAVYEFTVKNVGAATVTPTSFQEEVSASTFTTPKIIIDGVASNPVSQNGNIYRWGSIFSALTPGASKTFTFTAPITANFRANEVITTIGTINSDRETTLANNTSTLYYTIPLAIDLTIGAVDTGFVNPEVSGEIVGFTIHYTNSGNDLAKGLSMIVGFSGTSFGNQTISLPNLDMRDSATLVITGRIPTDYPIGTKFCLNGSLTSTNETASTTNNILPNLCYTFVDHADVVAAGRLTTATDTLNKGDLLNYVLTLTNSGGRIATGINFSTILSSALTAVSDSSWSNITLQPGESRDFALQVRLNNLPLNGIDIGITGTATFGGIESYKANNTFAVNSHLLGLSDVFVRHTMSPFSGFRQGDTVTYTITYGNSGARSSENTQLNISLPSVLQTAQTSWNLGSLAAGQSGTIVITATLNSFLYAGTNFTSQAIIATTTPQTTTGNDSSTISSTIGTINNFSFDISAQNITRPSLTVDPQTLVRAVSGDVIVYTITYANNGNVSGNNATIGFANAGRLLLNGFANNLGSLGINQQGSLTVTGTLIGSNFDAFSPVVTLAFNGTGISDTVRIEEPFACGDGMLTKTETCDTNGQLGVMTGQECQNQQGQCVVVTKFIANIACAEYAGGKVCSEPAIINLKSPSCGSLEVNKISTSSSTVQAICIGQYANEYTPMSINCGNGTILSGVATAAGNFVGSCSYGSSSEANSAKIACAVGTDTVNSACIRSAGSCTLTADTEIAIVSKNKDEGDIEYTCKTKSNTEAMLQIDCGNGDKSDIEQDDRFSYTCHYTQSDYDDLDDDKTLQAKCLINGAKACTQDVTLDPGFLGVCGNGEREGYEQCDDGSKNGTSSSSCSKGCSLGKEAASCLSLSNANVSVQDKEYLPFWWKIQDTSNIVSSSSCNSSSDKDKILRDSMKCTFSLKQPGEDAKEILSNVDCDQHQLPGLALFANFYPEYWSYAFGNYYINIGTVLSSSAFRDNLFGEYKIRLDSVHYQYCAYDSDSEEYQRKSTQTDNVCETNFVVTKPYLVQKSAFGVTPKAANINLDTFYDINGTKLVNKTDLDKVMVLDSTDYAGGATIKSMMWDFATKAGKLAVTIPNSSLPKTLKDAGVTVKKVPNKMIYILEGNGQKDVKLRPFANFSTPFTIITKNINIVIEGPIDVNGMFVVQGGTIRFNEGDPKCTGPQVVKGIFVAGNGFTADKIANTSLNTSRCNAGGLYVKGVLIGDGIDNLVQNRRSSLTNWFHVNGSENNIRIQRRNQIFNGAAVQIEYNPDLWKQLPPGAEEFTKALDIYKK